MNKKIKSVILLGLVCMSLTGCEKVEAYKSKIDAIKNEQSDKDELTQLNLKEDIILDYYNGGKYSLNLKEVKKTDERNEFASKDVKDVIVLDYQFENYSINEDIVVSEGVDFKVYDKKNNVLSSYPIAQSIKYPTPASVGSISSGSVALGSFDELDGVNIVIYNQDNPIGYISIDL